jgi:hypothetical protein
MMRGAGTLTLAVALLPLVFVRAWAERTKSGTLAVALLSLVFGTNCSAIDSVLAKRYNLQEIKSGGETGFL